MDARPLGHRFAYGGYEQATTKKCTKREKFLAEMNQKLPWQELIDLLELHYPMRRSIPRFWSCGTCWRSTTWESRSVRRKIPSQ